MKGYFEMDPLQELGKLLVPICEAKNSLDEVHTPFKEHGYIRPIQCRGAIIKLNELEKHVQNFCTFLDRTEYLPIVFTSLRYRPLLTLHSMQAQITMLVDSLEDHLFECVTPSEHLERKRKAIRDGFDDLLQYISDMPQQIQYFSDEVLFQERRLIANS
jgi:hypothetical protein